MCSHFRVQKLQPRLHFGALFRCEPMNSISLGQSNCGIQSSSCNAQLNPLYLGAHCAQYCALWEPFDTLYIFSVKKVEVVYLGAHCAQYCAHWEP